MNVSTGVINLNFSTAPDDATEVRVYWDYGTQVPEDTGAVFSFLTRPPYNNTSITVYSDTDFTKGTFDSAEEFENFENDWRLPNTTGTAYNESSASLYDDDPTPGGTATRIIATFDTPHQSKPLKISRKSGMTTRMQSMSLQVEINSSNIWTSNTCSI